MRKHRVRHMKATHTFLRESRIALTGFSEMCIGIGLSVTFLGFFLYFKEVVLQNQFFAFDKAVSYSFYAFRTPLLNKIFITIAFLGSEKVLVPLFIIFIAYLLWKKFKREALVFSLTFVTGYFLNTMLKLLIQRPRPSFAPLLRDSSYSFPSGHVMNSFIFYGTLTIIIFAITKNRHLQTLILILSILIILAVSASRIYLGVHYPTDVIAGFLGGIWWLFTAYALEKTFNFYKLFKQRKSKKSH